MRQGIHVEGMGIARKEKEGQGSLVSCCGKGGDGPGWADGTGGNEGLPSRETHSPNEMSSSMTGVSKVHPPASPPQDLPLWMEPGDLARCQLLVSP